MTESPDASLIEVLHRRTEGWAVGLRLALLALEITTDYTEFASHFDAVNTRYIADYLVDEVLDHQSPPLQDFLISTALLNRFSAGLCAAVLDIDEVEARRYIEHLERENLFLIGLSPSPQWYRYHHQFQEIAVEPPVYATWPRDDREPASSGCSMAVRPRASRRRPSPPARDSRCSMLLPT